MDVLPPEMLQLIFDTCDIDSKIRMEKKFNFEFFRRKLDLAPFKPMLLAIKSPGEAVQPYLCMDCNGLALLEMCPVCELDLSQLCRGCHHCDYCEICASESDNEDDLKPGMGFCDDCDDYFDDECEDCHRKEHHASNDTSDTDAE